MGIKRTAVPAGGFNTALGRCKDNLMGGEEKELFNRIKARNGRIYYFPGIEVRHVIPEKRTTKTYIRQLAEGAGKSERLRTLGHSRAAYLSALFREGIKWAATLLLCIGYTLCARPGKGGMLAYFRWFVTKGLLTR